LNFLIRYKLKPEITKQTKVSAWLRINIAEDAQRAKGEPLTVDVIDQATGRSIYRGVDPSFRMQLIPGKAKTFRVKSDAYARHQVVLFDEGESRTAEAK
jgi:hypothetical protein